MTYSQTIVDKLLVYPQPCCGLLKQHMRLYALVTHTHIIYDSLDLEQTIRRNEWISSNNMRLDDDDTGTRLDQMVLKIAQVPDSSWADQNNISSLSSISSCICRIGPASHQTDLQTSTLKWAAQKRLVIIGSKVTECCCLHPKCSKAPMYRYIHHFQGFNTGITSIRKSDNGNFLETVKWQTEAKSHVKCTTLYHLQRHVVNGDSCENWCSRILPHHLSHEVETYRPFSAPGTHSQTTILC